MVGAGCSTASDDRVRFTATDGVQLVGHLEGTRGAGIVFAHGARYDQRSWHDFAHATAAAGYRTLTFDFRGYGESEGTKDVGAIDRDLEGAYRCLVGRKIQPVILVGASMGGIAALLVAARVPVAGVATLSTPITLDALDADSILPEVRAPKLFIAAEGDAGAAAAVERLTERTPAPRLVRLVPGAAHGIELLSGATAEEVTRLLNVFFAASARRDHDGNG